jgi:TonB-linked SusC/RagA family outer membrane protein
MNETFFKTKFHCMKKKLPFLVMFLLLMVTAGSKAFAQKQELSGIVLNAEGLPIKLASIQVKGTKRGSTSDEKGEFKITANLGQELQVSSIGFVTRSIKVEKVTKLVITLTNSKSDLGEVVVTAFGISRQKKAVGYAVQDVSGEALEKVKPTNIVNALQGKVAGVQITNATGAVGSSSRIVIRGNSSFGQNEPLWVVDGTPFINFSSEMTAGGGQDYGNGALDLDPSNVESITVLKGANASALYGSRGANGVVLVTTKRGSREKNKLGIDVTSSVSFENAAIMPRWQDKYGGGQRGSEFDWKKLQPTMSYQDYSKKYAYNYVDGYGSGINDGGPRSWGPRMDIGLVLDQFTGKNQAWVSNPNNVNEFYETGITNDHSIALSKGNEVGAMRMFLAGNDITGTTPNTDYTKYTAGFSGDLNLSKRLTAGINMTYANNHSDNLPSQGYNGGGDNTAASFVFFQRQVVMPPLKANWDKLDAFGRPYSFAQGEMNNPYADAYNNASRTRNRLYGNVNMKYKVTDWMSVLGRLGTDYYNEDRKKTLRSISYDGNGTGTFWQSQIYAQEINADLLLIFNKKINDDFRIDGTLGGNYRVETSHQMRMNVNKLTVPDLFTVANVSGYPSISQNDSKKVTNSVLGSVNLSYKDYLFLGVTGRNDWSSALPKDNLSFFYPSISTGFVFSDAFKIKSDFFTYGKLRVGVAEVGNDTGPYNSGFTYSPVGGGPWNGITMYYLPGQMPPVNLKPENKSSVEAGLELKFFKNRFGIDVTLYDTKTTNQIMSVDIATSTGYNSALINAGEIQNKGIELILNGTPIDNPKGFSWDVSVNWAKNQNRVNKLYADLQSLFISSMWASSVEARPGEAYGVIRGKGLVYNPKGQLMVGTNGLPLKQANLVTYGNVTPKWIGGISNTFSYKGWSLYALIDGRYGGDIMSGTKLWGTGMGTLINTLNNPFTGTTDARENGILVPGVKPDGTANDVKVSAQDYWSNVRGIPETVMMDGSFVKLREVSLGYTFPKSLIAKLGIHSANLAFFARNLALLYLSPENDIRIDPETGFGTGNQGVGYEQMQIPTARSLGIKLSVSF